MTEEKKKFDVSSVFLIFIAFAVFVGGLFALGYGVITTVDKTEKVLQSKIRINNNDIKANRSNLKIVSEQVRRIAAMLEEKKTSGTPPAAASAGGEAGEQGKDAESEEAAEKPDTPAEASAPPPKPTQAY